MDDYSPRVEADEVGGDGFVVFNEFGPGDREMYILSTPNVEVSGDFEEVYTEMMRSEVLA
ncbi:hypothetical protein AArcMg_1781 [Natrarchaeobaculum sulfurireducens]|uniref:Uncharacterized protein n=1 Tax=Natrarchaeobaculum sulfurireducens TaxID=2044521 RepID=A0A346PQJ4_9EURY|nr:hypothetical protein AArcMg_1781 [Natrarchaeobaculum sulfurireducens]